MNRRGRVDGGEGGGEGGRRAIVMTYASAYRSSNGQPLNGYTEHTSKRAAIAAAKANRAALLLRSGGKAYAWRLNEWQDEEATSIYEWYEHAEGGFRTV